MIIMVKGWFGQRSHRYMHTTKKKKQERKNHKHTAFNHGQWPIHFQTNSNAKDIDFNALIRHIMLLIYCRLPGNGGRCHCKLPLCYNFQVNIMWQMCGQFRIPLLHVATTFDRHSIIHGLWWPDWCSILYTVAYSQFSSAINISSQFICVHTFL